MKGGWKDRNAKKEIPERVCRCPKIVAILRHVAANWFRKERRRHY